LHPLVCTAFNADFDGDQMAVHVPLSNASILEAQLLMLASHNVLNPQNGSPITIPSQDMVLGLYYLSKGKRTTKEEKIIGEGARYYSAEEAIIAFNEGKAHLNAFVKVKARVKEGNEFVHKVIETTIGRLIINEVMPEEVGYVNVLLTKGALKKVIGDVLALTNIPRVVKFLDDIKEIGFRWAFKGGLSFGIDDLIIPEVKTSLLENAGKEVDEIMASYNMGLITNNERYNQIVDIWTRADANLTEVLMKEISTNKQGFNSVLYDA
jgi:DNA-directed RNA polymerase subunit beta'